MRENKTKAIAAAVACALWACHAGAHEPAGDRPSAPRASAVTDASTPAPAPASSVDAGAPWDKVKYEDDLPLCVFASHEERAKAPFVKDVHKQRLRANTRIVFGTFPPDCMNEACDRIPTHQCMVDTEEPNMLVIHSRLSFEHKRGTVCTEDCSPAVLAGCESDPLKPGDYTVRYGTRTFSLRIPSVVRSPCFKLD